MVGQQLPLKPICENAVTVVCCGNDAFLAPTAVLFRSIMDHADPKRVYDLIFFHNGAQPRKLEKLCSMAQGNVSIRCRDISDAFDGEGLSVDNRPQLSLMTYARLLIPDLLSEGYNKVLYLDGDMIALRDVAELYDTDLCGKPIGSSRDWGMLSLVHGREEVRSYLTGTVGLSDPERYCMSALLLMDLAQLRRRFPTKELLKVAASGLWMWHDQDVINRVFGGEILHLDPAWDVIAPDEGVDFMPKLWRERYDRALEHPYIFHFAGMLTKPWDNYLSPYAAEFWEIAARTPFAQQLRYCLQKGQNFGEKLPEMWSEQDGGLKRLMKKVLPPPADSVRRDVNILLRSIYTESAVMLQSLLLTQLPPQALPREVPRDAELPVKPVLDEAVTVVCCGDERFVPPTAVLFRTIIDNASPLRQYDLIYLHNGLGEDTRRKLALLTEGRTNISLRTCDISAAFSAEGLFTENREHFSPMAYARLLIPDLLSEDYGRVLYLDGDMIALRDVAELYDADLGGNPIGSSVDMSFAVQAYGQRNKFERERAEYTCDAVGITRWEDYIITGMLVMDLRKLRAEYPAAKLFETAHLRQWRWHDQDVINHVFRGNIQMLDPAWDAYDCDPGDAPVPEALLKSWLRALADPAIFHYAGGGIKPWQCRRVMQSDRFWHEAARTPFYPELLRRKFLQIRSDAAHLPEGGDTTMLKKILKKILPPPVESVQRDLNTVLDALQEQKQISFMLMQQIEERGRADGQCGTLACKPPRTALRFEFALAAHCNLNCAGCSHFAPLAQEEFPDFEQSERAFGRLSELFGGQCEYIHLMGGEPLLNPRVKDYLVMARRCFPVGEIDLVTNGLLLEKQDDEFFEICARENITITVTPYPIRLDHDAIRARCEQFGAVYCFYLSDETRGQFNKIGIDPEGFGDMEENFRRCRYANNCLFLYNDRMYPCGVGTHLRLFRDRFGENMELTERDSVGIFEVHSGRELLYRLAKPAPMCRYCRVETHSEMFPWALSNRDRGEWV